jgi:hypothetical protein
MLESPPSLTFNLSDIPGTNSIGYRFETDTRLCFQASDEPSIQQYGTDGDDSESQYYQCYPYWSPMQYGIPEEGRDGFT